jgi:hypothetical protein
MSSLGVRAVVFCFPVILGWLPVAAQSASYHLEFEDNAGSKQVILVNDSERPIEAFAASQLCQGATGVSGSGGIRDILFYPSKDIDMQAADRSGPPRSGVLDKGARWSTLLAMMPERGDCQNRITAVFFSDGSFEGDDAAVRSLKAGRDGLAAGVHYWADRISREKPDGSTLNALLAELRERMAADRAKQYKYPTSGHRDSSAQPLWEYWESWLTVERDIKSRFPNDLGQEKPSTTLRRVADMIGGWKTKIDGNIALKKLNIVFPPISESSGSDDGRTRR